MAWHRCAAVLIIGLSSGESGAGSVTRVPQLSSESVEIDGRIGGDEWKGAHEVTVAPDVTLLVFQTKADVLLAVRLKTPSPAYVDLFLLLEDEKRINLHASMQVGERALPAKGWTDRDPPTHWGRQDHWRANAVKQLPGKPESAPLTETLVPHEGFEFRLSRDRFGGKGWRLRLEVRDFMAKRPDIIFPSPSTRMDSSSWGELRLSD